MSFSTEQKVDLTSDLDSSVLSQVSERYQQMLNYRNVNLSNADRQNKQVEAGLRTNPKTGEITPNVQIEHSVMEAQEAEMRAKPTPILYLPLENTTREDIVVYKHIIEDVKRKDKYETKLMNVRWAAMTHGYCPMFVGTEIKSQIIKKPVLNQQDKFESVEIKDLNVSTRYVPVRNFLFDTPSFDDAIDCIEIQKLSKQEYNTSFVGNKAFPLAEKFIDADGGDYIYLLHYWNKITDTYQVFLASETIKDSGSKPTLTGMPKLGSNNLRYTIDKLIRDDIIPYLEADGSKKLPYAMFYNTLDGKGITDKLLTTKHEINLMREIIQKTALKEGSSILTSSGASEFNSTEPMIGQDIQIWDVGLDGKLDKLQFPGPSAGIINYIDRLEKLDIPRYTGLSLDSLIVTPSTTKLQASLREEAKNKRMSNTLFLWDFFIQDIESMLYSRIKQFLILPILRSSKDKNKTNYKITVNDFDIIQKGGKNITAIQSSGKISTIEVNDDTVGDFKISVGTRSTQSIADIIEREQALEGINAVSGILAQLGQNVSQFKDLTGIDIKKLFQILLGSKIGELEQSQDNKQAEDNKKAFQSLIDNMPQPNALSPILSDQTANLNNTPIQPQAQPQPQPQQPPRPQLPQQSQKQKLG